MHSSEISSQNDKLYLQELQKGDPEAFDNIYNSYWEFVFSQAYKRLKDEDLAKDITQDIFLKIWNKRYDLNIQNLPAYLHTAVKNAVFNCLEKEKRYTPVTELIEETEAAGDFADTRLLTQELLRTRDVLVAKLTQSQQTIFRMHFHEFETTKVIAEKLGISRKTVQNQIGKSLMSLRNAMTIFF